MLNNSFNQFKDKTTKEVLVNSDITHDLQSRFESLRTIDLKVKGLKKKIEETESYLQESNIYYNKMNKKQEKIN